MIKYTVKYKRGLLWHVIYDVTGDGYFADSGQRWFMREDGVTTEIPAQGTIFVFSSARAELVKNNATEEEKKD